MENLEIIDLGEQFRYTSSVRNLLPSIRNNDIKGSLDILATSSKFGLVFILFAGELKVYRSCDLIDSNNCKPFGMCTLPGRQSHVAVSCDELTLLVAGNNDYGLPIGYFFDIRVFATEAQDYDYFYVAPLSAACNSHIESVCWSPTDPNCVAVAVSSGQIVLVQLKEKSVVFTSASVEASCVTWSAKGKQLAVGTKSGALQLFKTDLTPVRAVKPPTTLNIGAVISMNWFSNTEFFIGCRRGGRFPGLFLVTAPRSGDATYINMDDICYSGDLSKRPHYYYSIYIAEWNLLFAVCTHSSDVAMVGKSATNPNAWSQWFPEEGYRATLQNINVLEETFPIGFSTIFCSQKTFPGKDEKVKGPFPALLSFTTGGELNIFHVENNITGGNPLTIVAGPIPSIGARTNEQYGITLVKNIPNLTNRPSVHQAAFDNGNIVASTPIKSSNNAPSKTESESANSLFTAPTSTPAVSSSGLNQLAPKPDEVAGKAAEALYLQSQKSTFPAASNIAQPSFKANVDQSSSAQIVGQPLQSSSNVAPPFSGQAVTIAPPVTDQNAQRNSSIGSLALGTSRPPPGNSIIASTPFTAQQTQDNSNVASTLTGQSILANSGITSPFTGQVLQNISKVTSSSQAGHNLQPSSSAFIAQSSASPAPASMAKPQIKDYPAVVPSQDSRATSSVPTKPSAAADKTKSTTIVPKRLKSKLMQQITNELISFEKALVTHGNANRRVDLKVGADGDKKIICNQIAKLNDWMKELQSTVKDQCEETAVLHEGAKTNFALYEDAEGQCDFRYSEKKQTFGQLRPLDPHSRRKLDDVRAKYQYLRSQISEVNTMLDSEWENYNLADNSKSKEYCGRNYEKIHRSVLQLKTMRLSIESQLDYLCTLMRVHNLDGFLETPDDDEDIANTSNRNMDTSRVGLQVSAKNMKHLERVLSERKFTPVRHFSTPKGNASVNGGDLALKLNLEESPICEPSPTQHPLTALKSFVTQTTPIGDIVDPPTADKPVEHVQKSPSIPPTLSGDAAIWQRYKMAMTSQMGGNLPMHQVLPQSGIIPGVTGSSVLSSMLSAPPIVSVESTLPGSKPLFNSGSLSGATSIFQAAGPASSAAMFPAAKASFAVPSNINSTQPTQTAAIGATRQSDNKASIFSLPFAQTAAVQPNPAGMLFNSLMSTQGVPRPVAGLISPGIASQRFPGQSQFGFNTNFGSTNVASKPTPHAVVPVSVTSHMDTKPETAQFGVVTVSVMPTSCQAPSVKSTEKDEANAAVSKLSALPSISLSVIPAASQKHPESSGTTGPVTFMFGTQSGESSKFSAGATRTNQLGNSVGSFSAPFGQKVNSSSTGVSDGTAVVSFGNVQSLISGAASEKRSLPTSAGVSQPLINTSADSSKSFSGATKLPESKSAVHPNISSQTTAPVATTSDQNSDAAKTMLSLFAASPQATAAGSSAALTADVTISKISAPQSFPTTGANLSTTLSSATPSVAFSFTSVTTSSVPTSNSFVSNTQLPVTIGGIVSAPSSSSFTSTTTGVPAAVTIGPAATSVAGDLGRTGNKPNIFESASTTPTVLEGATNGATVFCSAVATSGSGIFGTTVASSNSSVFGGAAAKSSSSIFGGDATTSNSSVFGGAVTTSSSSVFGGAVTTSSSNVFGGNVTASSSGVFGGAPTASSAFGGGVSTSSTAAFGAPVSIPGQSVFGGPSPTTTDSIFGGNVTSNDSIFREAAVSSSSIFGGSNATSTTDAFGHQTPSAFGNAFGSNSFGTNKPFGAGNSVFGGSNSSNSGQSAFGNNASIFGNTMQSDNTPQDSTKSAFGTNAGVFGGTTTPAVGFGGQSGSVFGGSSNASSAFGNVANSAPKGFSVFGNSASSSANQPQSAFAGIQICSDIGGTPDAAKASQNVFGVVAAPSNTNQSLFKPNPGQPPASPFGQAKPTASAFGGSPSFGGAPAFGGSPAFGTSPTFASAAFGGAAIFGGNSSTAAQNTSSTFQNNSKPVFGNQNDSSSFGSIAQQQTDDSFGKSSFGGNAFSSWRS